MLRLFQSIFGTVEKSSSNYDDQLLERAIERVVDGTDPRLRALSGYRRRLRPGVIEALDYTFELVDSLSEPVLLSRDRFSKDDRIRSFFVSPDHIDDYLSRNRSLQVYLDKRTGLDPENLFALQAISRVEKKVLGMEMTGDILRRDVSQISVSFTNPRLSAFGDDEAATLFEIKKDVFDYFIQIALKNLVATRHKRQPSSNKPDIHADKLRTLQSANWGMESVLSGAEERRVDTNRAERDISKIESEFAHRQAAPPTLDQYLETVADSMAEVRKLLWREAVTIRTDRMGIKVTKEENEAAITLDLNEYCSAEGHRVVALPVCIPFETIPTRPDFLTEASRYL